MSLHPAPSRPVSNVVEFRRPTASATVAVILVRVSTREQEDGFSIEAQKHRLLSYCERKGLEVVRVFEIVESSTRGERKKFMDMIGFIKRIRQPVALVADKIDRVQRSFREFPLLDGLINAGRLELHFNTENYVIHQFSASNERMMWSMGVIMAQSYTDSLRDNVRRALDQKIRNGEYACLAPIGYVNSRDKNGKSDITLDPQRAPLVTRIFTEYATGIYSINEMLHRTRDWGLTNRTRRKSWLVKSHLHKLLSNPFYYGEMQIKGQIFPHRYAPLIDRDTWAQCQKVLHGWHDKPFKWGSREHVFRGLLIDAATGKVALSSTQTKTYAGGGSGAWTYLCPTDPQNPAKKLYVREEKVLEQVEAALDELRITPDLHERITAYIRQTDHVERDYQRRRMAELQKEQNLTQSRLDALMDLLLDGAITRDEHEAKRNALRSRQAELLRQVETHQQADDGFKDCLITLISLAGNAKAAFAGSNKDEKRIILNCVFSNLSLNGATLCYSFNKPFDRMAKCHEFEEWGSLVDDLRTIPELRRIVNGFKAFKIAA